MKLPDSLIDDQFAQRFKRGVIIRYLMPDPDDPCITNRFKYALVVNTNSADSQSILLLATSQVEKYQTYFQNFPDAYHELAEGSYPWVETKTLLSLREAKTYERDFLLRSMKSENAQFEDELRKEDMDAIESKLRRSIFIERRVLKQIISF